VRNWLVVAGFSLCWVIAVRLLGPPRELGVWQVTGQKQGAEAVPPAGGTNFRVRFTFFMLSLCLLCVVALCPLFLLELWHALK